eukprot:PhF_6_TR26003/c0_g1_i1/m.36652
MSANRSGNIDAKDLANIVTQVLTRILQEMPDDPFLETAVSFADKIKSPERRQQMVQKIAIQRYTFRCEDEYAKLSRGSINIVIDTWKISNSYVEKNFYEEFFRPHPSVAELFKSTDMGKQSQQLFNMLDTAVGLLRD